MNYILLVLWFLSGWLGWALLRWDWSKTFNQSYWCLTPKQYIGVFFLGFFGFLLVISSLFFILIVLFEGRKPGAFRQWLNKPVCK